MGTCAACDSEAVVTIDAVREVAEEIRVCVEHAGSVS